MVPTKVEILCRRAQEAIAERDWEKAKQFYLKALEFHGNAVEVHHSLALVYMQLHEVANAAYHYHEVTRLDPKRARAFINLGAALHLLGELDDAEAALLKGLQLDTTRGEGYYLLALVYKARGQLDKSLLAFKEALRCNPRLVDAMLGLGELHLLKNQPEMALACYEQALQVRPNHDKALAGQRSARAALSRHGTETAVKPEEPHAEEANGLMRTADPETDGIFLTELHQAAGFVEHRSRLLQKIFGEEVAPAIVDLSRALVNSNVTRADLTDCLTRFETALERARAARQSLNEEIRRIEEISTRTPKK